MNPQQLRAKLEAGRGVHSELGDRSITPTGQPYVALFGPGGALDAETAFNTYAVTKPGGRLYWRVYPELRAATRHSPPCFYMRLYIG